MKLDSEDKELFLFCISSVSNHLCVFHILPLYFNKIHPLGNFRGNCPIYVIIIIIIWDNFRENCPTVIML